MATKLSDGIEQYGLWVKATYAPSTSKNYISTMERFLLETGNLWLHNVTERHTDSYLAMCTEKGHSPGTVNNQVAYLKSFAEFCRRRKLVPASWDMVGYRRRQKKLPDARLYIPQDRFTELLDTAGAHSARDRAVVATGLYLLVRQSEAAAITLADVDLRQGWVDIQILKTRARDTMPVSAELDTEWRRWLKFYTAKVGELQPEYLLLPSRPTGGLRNRGPHGQLLPCVHEDELDLLPLASPSRIDSVIQRCLKVMGYPTKGTGMHTLRRSGARALYETLASRGHDSAVRQVQAVLHHSVAATTEHYIGLTLETQRRNVNMRGQRMYDPPKIDHPKLEIVR